MKDFLHIGKKVVRQDGQEKVTGQARFADDISFPGQLYGVMVRIPAVHARIRSIDYSALDDHPAITVIVDANDVPGAKKVGAIRQDQPIFSYDKVVTCGDVLAMLVGQDVTELRRLSRQVKVDYEPLPVLSDPRQALEKSAPRIHEQYEDNLVVHYPLRKGDVNKAFAGCDHILEQTYTTPFIEHAYLEPECVIAVPLEGNKGVQVIGSIQNPHTTRKIVAAALDWPLAKVRVRQAELGGSFGGKDDSMNILSARAALAALKTGRAVKIRYSREDSIRESYKRHPYVLNYKVGYQKSGRIRAMKIDILADAGAYASMSPFVTWRTVVQATGPYEIENVHTDVRAVYTNNPYTGAMRGFGSPQPIFAQESIMDEIAVHLNMRPDELRRINAFRQGSKTASGQELGDHDVNLITVLDEAVSRTGFAEKWPEGQKLPPLTSLPDDRLVLMKDDFIAADHLWRKGIGLSVSYRGCSLGAEGIDAAAAYLSVQNDGSAYLLSGLAENGQGMRTTFCIIAAEVLGIPVDRIFYLEQDTGLVPDSGPTVASRSTLMGGGAVRQAAEKVRARIAGQLCRQWGLSDADSICFREGKVYPQEHPHKAISFAEACMEAYKSGISLAAMGWYAGPHVDWDEATGQGSAYFTYVYGCQVAEVRVNSATGEVYVDRVTAVHDPGRVINLLGAQGQVYGGVTQGAGYGLWEAVTSKDGAVRELNFDQYLIPTSKDIGQIEPVFIEGREKYGPWGGKSLGEPTLELTAAAIANAVRNATGRRSFNLPLNLEEVLLRRKLSPEGLKRGSA